MNWLLDRLPPWADRWHYIGVLALCLVLTSPLEWAFGARVYRRPGATMKTLVAVLVPFVATDGWAVRRGLWSYSQQHVVRVTLFGTLPLEEVLFFVVIPLCALLTFSAVTAMLDHGPRGHLPRDRKVD